MLILATIKIAKIGPKNPQPEPRKKEAKINVLTTLLIDLSIPGSRTSICYAKIIIEVPIVIGKYIYF